MFGFPPYLATLITYTSYIHTHKHTQTIGSSGVIFFLAFFLWVKGDEA
jgi:hypothetical protein